jgi:diguanylate cyclase (GGDEF)-like protein
LNSDFEIGSILRHDSGFTTELITQVIRYGLEPFLQSTRIVIALLDASGRFVAGNPALNALRREVGGASSFKELVIPALGEYADSLFPIRQNEPAITRAPLEFGSGSTMFRFECLIIPLERGGALLFAEPLLTDAGLLSINEQLEAELQTARSALLAKSVELKAVIAQADEVAHTDTLTLLPNRRLIIADLQRQVTYAERYGTPLSVSMLDIDNFKPVNDASGHVAGDKVLTVIAKELRDHIRQPDEIGRYGGDEFLVILPNTSAVAASEQAVRLCQRIRSTAIPFAEQLIRLTLSIGITQFNIGAENWQQLVERADRALYEAKRAGGDQWVILES